MEAAFAKDAPTLNASLCEKKLNCESFSSTLIILFYTEFFVKVEQAEGDAIDWNSPVRLIVVGVVYIKMDMILPARVSSLWRTQVW